MLSFVNKKLLLIVLASAFGSSCIPKVVRHELFVPDSHMDGANIKFTFDDQAGVMTPILVSQKSCEEEEVHERVTSWGVIKGPLTTRLPANKIINLLMYRSMSTYVSYYSATEYCNAFGAFVFETDKSYEFRFKNDGRFGCKLVPLEILSNGEEKLLNPVKSNLPDCRVKHEGMDMRKVVI